MFSNLFFLFLFLALINFIPELETPFWITSSLEAFSLGLLIYAVLLLGILGQIKLLSKFTKWPAPFYVILANLELLLFFCLYHFGLGSHRWLLEGQYLSALQSPSALFALILYLSALGWVHYWLARHHLTSIRTTPLRHAGDQLLFLLPFCFPFLIFSLFFDGLNLLPFFQTWLQPSDSWLHTAELTSLSLAVLIATLLFMPPLIVTCWRCRPLVHPFLTPRLESLCRRMHFKHAGIKVWTIMRHSFTAGIIGILPRFRYIMFTPNLIHQFPLQEIEAILLHEIGHSRYKHLWIYPFILLGMLVTATWLSLFYTEPLYYYFASQYQAYPSEVWYFFFLVTLFSLYALILALYFRYVFGFFSRLFERQADLHIFESSLPPIYMVHALDHIAVVTGHSHSQPNWHHFSIQERIDFLDAAIQHPSLVNQYHRKVRRYVILYFIVLGIALAALGFFLG